MTTPNPNATHRYNIDRWRQGEQAAGTVDSKYPVTIIDTEQYLPAEAAYLRDEVRFDYVTVARVTEDFARHLFEEGVVGARARHANLLRPLPGRSIDPDDFITEDDLP